eukprot:TRINITY_DN112004_c0_g1_i1.p1 TRINITY_DN112004_c0_g1~~TRINITY_DN112004_c0_g1_i1.p1  ORF type:complete len:801 (-),score=165.70 TRINITY_DN112004_c0_g1_i1:184-2586(-)
MMSEKALLFDPPGDTFCETLDEHEHSLETSPDQSSQLPGSLPDADAEQLQHGKVSNGSRVSGGTAPENACGRASEKVPAENVVTNHGFIEMRFREFLTELRGGIRAANERCLDDLSTRTRALQEDLLQSLDMPDAPLLVSLRGLPSSGCTSSHGACGSCPGNKEGCCEGPQQQLQAKEQKLTTGPTEHGLHANAAGAANGATSLLDSEKPATCLATSEATAAGARSSSMGSTPSAKVKLTPRGSGGKPLRYGGVSRVTPSAKACGSSAQAAASGLTDGFTAVMPVSKMLRQRSPGGSEGSRMKPPLAAQKRTKLSQIHIKPTAIASQPPGLLPEDKGQKATQDSDLHSNISAILNTPRKNQEKRRQIFADADTLKIKLREKMQEEKDRESPYHAKGCAARIVRSALFEHLTLLLVALNGIWLAVMTDYNNHDLLIDSHVAFQLGEHVFCIVFSMEWFVRFCAYKNKMSGLRDAWFVFDGMLLAGMIAETWIMSLVFVTSGDKNDRSSLTQGTSMLKMAKMLRLTRMARMVRLLRMIPEMMMLIKGILIAMRGAIASFSLMTLITYMFAIALTQLCEGAKPELRGKFDSVAESMKTMMILAVVPDLYEIVEDLGAEEGWMRVAIFCVFIFMVGVTLLNMFVGIMVQVVYVTANLEKEEYHCGRMYDTLLKILSKMDIDGDGTLDMYEFTQALQSTEVHEFLESCDIDVVGLVEHLNFLFKSGRQFDFGEIIGIMLDLRGSTPCTVKHIVTLRAWVSSELEELHDKISQLVQTMMRASGGLGGTAEGDGTKAHGHPEIGLRK